MRANPLTRNGRCCAAGLAAVLAAVLGGCAAPAAPGVDQTNYYYARRDKAPPAAAVVRPAPAAAPAAAVPAPNGPFGVARIVYFEFDRAVVRPQDREVVRAHADYLRRTPGSTVVLEGHTDEQGGRAYNVALGQKRAEAVRGALQVEGTDPARAEAVSFGMEMPATTDTTDAGRQRNRRVEFRYR